MPTLAPFQLAADLWSHIRPATAPSQLLQPIHDAADILRDSSDDQLKAKADALRASPRDILVPAFALVLESARRVHGIELFDTQLLAGMAMAHGSIAEMATGEGKTLAAALPAMFFACSGGGIHVATPNAYLAQRDFERIAPILRLLGTTVGLVPEDADAVGKRAAYACDVAYATGYELGFDYLRDRLQLLNQPQPGLGERQLALLRGESLRQPIPIQPQRRAAIIDEIDSVLIDEACLPLVISEEQGAGSRERGAGSMQTPCSLLPAPSLHFEAQHIAVSLRAGDDFHLDVQNRSIQLTAAGRQRVYEDYAARLRLPLLRPWAEYVEQALVSQHLFRRNVDYIVADGRVMLVDEFTGRIFADRTWREGLHQAVEAKEGLLPSPELRTAARISRQRFFRLYDTVCGMTGTAADSQREFHRHYGLAVVPIPLRLPSRRVVLPPRFFIDAEAKFRAIVTEVIDVCAAGRPVLVGSRTIRNSEVLAERLASAGVPFELLNGRQDCAEAEIIARAGQRGAVTIATNMAGRGTDILLGPGVAELGGMHVIAAEAHESRRIDRQLLGRAGRQGDPGSGRLFISASDDLLHRFAPHLTVLFQSAAHLNGEIHSDFSRDIASAQKTAESAAYSARRKMLALDRWHDEIDRALGGATGSY